MSDDNLRAELYEEIELAYGEEEARGMLIILMPIIRRHIADARDEARNQQVTEAGR